MPSELNFTPAHELAQRIRSKQLSPVELMQACFDRIDETNEVLNAWTGMRDRDELLARGARDGVAHREGRGPGAAGGAAVRREGARGPRGLPLDARLGAVPRPLPEGRLDAGASG